MRNLLKNAQIFCSIAIAIVTITTFESASAAPPALNLDVPVKVFTGRSQAPGGKVLATDGVKFYSAYLTDENSGGATMIKLSRGSNNGKQWDSAGTIAVRGRDALDNQISVAANKDVASTSRSIVHVVWNQGDDTRSGTMPGLYYSWASDSDLNIWSAPARINGDVTDVRSISIVASKAGELHVVFMGNDRKIYYCSAPSHKAVFTKPVLVTGTPMDDERAVDVALDSSNNLHLAFASVDDKGKIGIKYSQKAAKSAKWTAPVDVSPPTLVSESGYVAIAAADASQIHIASTVSGTTLDVYSSNGGKLWAKKTVATDKPSAHISIVAGANKALTVGVAFANADTDKVDSRIYRSTDGATWSDSAIVANGTSANIAVDSNGKVGILTYDATTDENNHAHYFSKER